MLTSGLVTTLPALGLLIPLALPSHAFPLLASYPTASGYNDPRINGGSMLTDSFNGYGEPLNVVVSGLSDETVLTPAGFLNYALSLNFGQECGGLHLGGYQAANLGDGLMLRNQTGILRENFGDQVLGTCRESLEGGNHFRYWQQNGTLASTGAYFIAASIEVNATAEHNIEPNGYDLGRDDLVSRANKTSGTANAGITYHTAVEMVSGLLQSGSNGINHNISIDGMVAVLTVTASGNKTDLVASRTPSAANAHFLVQASETSD